MNGRIQIVGRLPGGTLPVTLGRFKPEPPSNTRRIPGIFRCGGMAE
jgi:hypothetical protein